MVNPAEPNEWAEQFESSSIEDSFSVQHEPVFVGFRLTGELATRFREEQEKLAYSRATLAVECVEKYFGWNPVKKEFALPKNLEPTNTHLKSLNGGLREVL